MIIKLRFYRAFQKKSTLVDWLIGVFTLSRYSHVEIEVNNVSMSTSFRDGLTRAKTIDYTKAEWNTISINAPQELVDNIKKIFNRYSGKKYDKIGALASSIGMCIDNDKVFCSEFVAECLGIEKPCKFNPGSLYRHLTKKTISPKKHRAYEDKS
jgi:hypothetical protein